MTTRRESPEEARARLGADRPTPVETEGLWQRILADASGAPVRRRAARSFVVFGFGTALAAAAALLLVVERKLEPTDGLASACVPDPGADRYQVAAHCPAQSVQVKDTEWSIAADSQVQRTAEGARMISGRVRFRVRHHDRQDFRVRVSHGAVRVTGTVFEVEQGAAGGSVAVTEGSIEFQWDDGQREAVRAGQTLHWPRTTPPRGEEVDTESDAIPPPLPEIEKARPQVETKVSRTPSPIEPDRATAPALEQQLDRLMQLQSQNRHGEAVTLLRGILQQPGLSQAQRQRFDYALGLALEAAGTDACAHWRRHVEQFGTTAHEAALVGRLQGCQAM